MKYKEFILGQVAIKFIKERLSYGYNDNLSKYLLEKFNLDNGKVVTYLPYYVNQEPTIENLEGGILPEPPGEYMMGNDGKRHRVVLIPSTYDALVDIIKEYLDKGEKRICILEDAIQKPADPHVFDNPTEILIYNDEVYHILSGDNIEKEKIDKSINVAHTTYQFVGVLTYMPNEIRIPPKMGEKITLDNLKHFAEKTEKIIIGAYDGEGFLIWSSVFVK